MRKFIAQFPPAYFAMVMATGIVSVASHLTGFQLFASLLFWLNIALYVFLWGVTAARIVWFRDNFLNDFSDLKRGPGYFTTIAATCILGTQSIVMKSAFFWGAGLWVAGIALWGVLIYSVFMSFVAKDTDSSINESISGSWLVATVSTQSVSILSALHINRFVDYGEITAFLSLCLFLVGAVLYLIIITLISYRILFFKLDVATLSPTYWINSGAVAISTLAGATLVENGQEILFIKPLTPFIVGLTVTFWSVATWWIPLLALMGIWRHGLNRVPLTYNPEYWSLVFPLGMYTVCSFHLSAVLNLGFIKGVSNVFVYFALIAWLMTFCGFVKSLFVAITSGEE
jgi:tellurite resistance protein TehA-like permease